MRECKCGHASRRISVAILDREEEEGSHQESRRHRKIRERGLRLAKDRGRIWLGEGWHLLNRY